ncbi:MAG: acyl-CoA thioesterase, partial [Chloroflexaceae bacterium]
SLMEMGIILAEQTISYKRPAYFGERLGIGGRVTMFGTKSFTMEYVVARAGDGAMIATGQSVQVAYDYTTERTVAVPEALRAAVARRQAGRDPSHEGEAGEGGVTLPLRPYPAPTLLSEGAAFGPSPGRVRNGPRRETLASWRIR